MARGGRPEGMGGELGKMLDKAELYGGVKTCFVCNKPIKGNYGECAPGASLEENISFYHLRTCGPGSELRFLNYPTEAGFYLAFSSEDDIRYLEEFSTDRRTTRNNIIKRFLKEMALREKFIKFRRKQMKTEGKSDKKKGNEKNLVKKEAVQVPAKLYEHPAIGAILTEMKTATGKDASKCRRQLRAVGFSLSDSATWEPFKKSKKHGVKPKAEKRATKEKAPEKEKKTSKKEKKEAPKKEKKEAKKAKKEKKEKKEEKGTSKEEKKTTSKKKEKAPKKEKKSTK